MHQHDSRKLSCGLYKQCILTGSGYGTKMPSTGQFKYPHLFLTVLETESPRSGNQHGGALVRDFLGEASHWPVVITKKGKRRKLSGVSCIRALMLFMRSPPPLTQLLSKAPYWKLEFEHMMSGEGHTHTFSPQHILIKNEQSRMADWCSNQETQSTRTVICILITNGCFTNQYLEFQKRDFIGENRGWSTPTMHADCIFVLLWCLRNTPCLWLNRMKTLGWLWPVSLGPGLSLNLRSVAEHGLLNMPLSRHRIRTPLLACCWC
jgi:hypothetical protein